MTEDEIRLFREVVRESRCHLEFGAGGSTFDVLLNTRAKIYSVESSLEWIQHLRGWRYIVEAERDGRLMFEHVDIGRTGDWGVPMELEKRELFPRYSSGIFDKHPIRFDTVLVDGRFRVASGLNAILHGGLFTRFLVHDFWDRPQYRVLLKYLDLKAEAGTLLVAGPKAGIDPSELRAEIVRFQYMHD
jgi:hypothetical protein